jgi:tetratricopeptide (TPR) repeat protein
MVGGRKIIWAATALFLILGTAKAVHAQRPVGSEPLGTVQPTSKDSSTGSTQPADPVQPVSKQENKALKAFRDTPESDADKKTQLGEEFITNYPVSRFRPEVVTWLAKIYLTKGQVDKLQAEGDKELTLTPSNPLSLALLGSNLSRAVTPSTPDKEKHLEQAELYCKKALEDLETTKKPADISDDKFTQAKNQTASVAYSGMGTVAFRNQKYADAVTNLDQSIKLGGGSDPVNYYLLGKANEASTNYSAALDAYTKCAALPGGMQAPCQSSITAVKAHGAVLPK